LPVYQQAVMPVSTDPDLYPR